MRGGLLILLISLLIANNSMAQSSCKPNVNIEVDLVMPDSIIGTLSCRPGVYLRPRDQRLTIISFTELFSVIPGEEDYEEVFKEESRIATGPKERMMIMKMSTGSIIGFYCIKAKNQNGQVLILQPAAYQITATGIRRVPAQ